MTEEVMAIIKEVGIGMRDVNEPILWWTANTGNKGCSLQIFDCVTLGDLIQYHLEFLVSFVVLNLFQ